MFLKWTRVLYCSHKKSGESEGSNFLMTHLEKNTNYFFLTKTSSKLYMNVLSLERDAGWYLIMMVLEFWSVKPEFCFI